MLDKFLIYIYIYIYMYVCMYMYTIYNPRPGYFRSQNGNVWLWNFVMISIKSWIFFQNHLTDLNTSLFLCFWNMIFFFRFMFYSVFVLFINPKYTSSFGTWWMSNIFFYVRDVVKIFLYIYIHIYIYMFIYILIDR